MQAGALARRLALQAVCSEHVHCVQATGTKLCWRSVGVPIAVRAEGCAAARVSGVPDAVYRRAAARASGVPDAVYRGVSGRGAPEKPGFACTFTAPPNFCVGGTDRGITCGREQAARRGRGAPLDLPSVAVSSCPVSSICLDDQAAKQYLRPSARRVRAAVYSNPIGPNNQVYLVTETLSRSTQ